MGSKLHLRKKRHRRLSKQRIKSGKVISRHQSKSGRTGMVQNKKNHSGKPSGYHSTVEKSTPGNLSIYEVKRSVYEVHGK